MFKKNNRHEVIMHELLTIQSTDFSKTSTYTVAPPFTYKEYSQIEIDRFMEQAACWELIIERRIHFVLPADWDDYSTYIKDISPDMLVIHNDTVVGIFYDSCFFSFNDTSTRSIYNSRPDHRNIGANFIGGVQYSIHYHPNSTTLYSDDKRVLNSVPKNYKGKFEIQSGTEEISNAAFYRCTELTEVRVPSSVKRIGHFAFGECVELKTIIIEDGVEVYGDSCFAGIKGPLTISEPATLLYNKGPNSSIISHYLISQNHPRLSSIDGVKFSKDGTTLLQYPQAREDEKYVVPDCTTQLGYAAFSHCPKLKELILSQNLIKIGPHSINYCRNLEIIYIPQSVEVVEWNYFRGCNKLKTLYIHKSNTSFDITNWKERASGSLEIEGNLFLDNLDIIRYE